MTLIERIKKRLFYLLASSHRVSAISSIKKVGILAKVPQESKKFDNWHDGFVAAVELLRQDYEVDIIDFCTYAELAEYYNRSRKCYVPCELHGGGERCVLEARACGIAVEVELDNPKLSELTDGEIWDHKYYYKQLVKGMNSTV